MPAGDINIIRDVGAVAAERQAADRSDAGWIEPPLSGLMM
jgi:hypothetical protein